MNVTSNLSSGGLGQPKGCFLTYEQPKEFGCENRKCTFRAMGVCLRCLWRPVSCRFDSDTGPTVMSAKAAGAIFTGNNSRKRTDLGRESKREKFHLSLNNYDVWFLVRNSDDRRIVFGLKCTAAPVHSVLYDFHLFKVVIGQHM